MYDALTCGQRFRTFNVVKILTARFCLSKMTRTTLKSLLLQGSFYVNYLPMALTIDTVGIRVAAKRSTIIIRASIPAANITSNCSWYTAIDSTFSGPWYCTSCYTNGTASQSCYSTSYSIRDCTACGTSDPTFYCCSTAMSTFIIGISITSETMLISFCVSSLNILFILTWYYFRSDKVRYNYSYSYSQKNY